jgi:hypothetical protein
MMVASFLSASVEKQQLQLHRLLPRISALAADAAVAHNPRLTTMEKNGMKQVHHHPVVVVDYALLQFYACGGHPRVVCVLRTHLHLLARDEDDAVDNDENRKNQWENNYLRTCNGSAIYEYVWG